MGSVHAHQEEPKEEADNPWMPRCPVLEYKLRRGQVRCDRDGVVEPVVPRECKSIRRREEPHSIRVERSLETARRVNRKSYHHKLYSPLTGNGVLCSHLAKQQKRHIDYNPNDSIAQEHTCWTTLRKGPSSTKE